MGIFLALVLFYTYYTITVDILGLRIFFVCLLTLA
jgi:hypothetical protein